MFSNLVSYRVFGRSLFDVQLRMRGFDLSAGRDKAMLDQRRIESYVTRDYTALAPDTPLDEAISRLLESRVHEGYVVDAGGVYLGTVKLEELVRSERSGGLDPESTLARFAKPEALILSAGTSVWHAMEQMGDFVGESIPVLEEGDDRRMLGVVFEASIVKAYMDTMEDIRREENAGA